MSSLLTEEATAVSEPHRLERSPTGRFQIRASKADANPTESESEQETSAEPTPTVSGRPSEAPSVTSVLKPVPDHRRSRPTAAGAVAAMLVIPLVAFVVIARPFDRAGSDLESEPAKQAAAGFASTETEPEPEEESVTPSPVLTSDELATEDRSLDRSGWLVDASHSHDGEQPRLAFDGRDDTRWSTGIVQEADMWFEIDLGSVQEFSHIELFVPGNAEQDSPRGYEIYVSADGEDFGLPVAVGEPEFGNLQISFESQEARYIEIVQTGFDDKKWWSISEVFVYADNGDGVLDSSPDSPDAAEPNLTDSLSTASTPAGAAIDPAKWRVEASQSHEDADPLLAVDGDPETRWTTGALMMPGMFVLVNMVSSQEFSGIDLLVPTTAPDDGPLGFEVYVYDEHGEIGRPVLVSGHDGGDVNIRFEETQTGTFIRIVQTGHSSKFWWSIGEIVVYE